MKNLALCDVNACYGRGSSSQADFNRPEDLIQHLDLLGIEQALVWNYQARDVNPNWGNRQLLADLDALPTAQAKRLIPAFVITPACFYEKGSLDFLKQHCASNRVRALRIFPAASRFAINQLERMLLELSPFKPVVLMDCRDFGNESDSEQLGTLARKLPDVTFVVTQKMWGGFGGVIDLMWRCPNVCVDISYIHMRENIELLLREFGSDRVLFGTGPKSHYGAAIAALVFADLTTEERAKIAHGNLERLLAIPPADFVVTGEVAEKPLWDAFRQGRAVEPEVFDVHAHVGPLTLGWYMPENDYETQLAKLVARMDQLGVDKIFVCGGNALFGECVSGNRILEQKTQPYRGRVFGYLGFNPRYGEETSRELDHFFSGDFFIGFKLLASYWKVPVTDAGYLPVWEYANQHALPILLHTWDDSYNSPAMLAEIAPRYPNAKFLLGHSGGGTRGRAESVDLAATNPNVYLEFCGSFTTAVDWLETFAAVGFDRVVFGSDTNAHDQAWELGRLLSIPVPDEKLIPVLSQNYRRLVKI